jgi:hypothetical protein
MAYKLKINNLCKFVLKLYSAAAIHDCIHIILAPNPPNTYVGLLLQID